MRTVVLPYFSAGKGRVAIVGSRGGMPTDPHWALNLRADPNATIDPAYRLTTVLTGDGQLFSGFIVHQDDKFVDLRTQETRVRVALDEVIELHTLSRSMMPEGMLAGFSDEQVRDLLLYLGSASQVDPPRGGR